MTTTIIFVLWIVTLIITTFCRAQHVTDADKGRGLVSKISALSFTRTPGYQRRVVNRADKVLQMIKESFQKNLEQARQDNFICRKHLANVRQIRSQARAFQMNILRSLPFLAGVFRETILGVLSSAKVLLQQVANIIRTLTGRCTSGSLTTTSSPSPTIFAALQRQLRCVSKNEGRY